MSVIHLNQINFSYTKNVTILENINLNVPEGSIYGFLGANGAGKSTTLRLILGLIKAQSGTISMFGEEIRNTYPNHLSKVGSLIESASLYDHLSATDNLKIAAKYYNTPTSSINEVLKKVKLEHTAKKKTKDFSTGMKQRLGLAIALLHNPEILILDEPTNGLDPNGIIELRQILKTLNEEGKTILLSSHILSEVEKIVSRLGIIKNGSIVFEGSIAELQELRGKNIEVHFIVSDSTAASKLLGIYDYKIIDDHRFTVIVNDKNTISKIINQLVNHQVEIFEVTPQSNDLENMFLSMTNA